MIDFVGRRRIWYSLSLLTVVAAVVVGALWRLNPGIDFTGGSLLEVSYQETRPALTQIETGVAEAGVEHVQIQPVGENGYILKTPSITNDQKGSLLAALPGATEQSFQNVGPTIGAELARKAWWAIGAVLIAIVLFISYAFRQVSKGPVPAWVFGIAAIVALAHDIWIVLGVFIVLGHFKGIEIDALFVTALLTVLGFSVHDTIVVFDRIRERLKLSSQKTFEEILNESINATLVRSIGTSFTTVLVLLALYFFGGVSIHYFVLALIVGIVSGTYSSIFIASPLLLTYSKFAARWKSRK
ncbi:MAG: protein translocase subunit SecF [Patescibacteria group bacterium]